MGIGYNGRTYAEGKKIGWRDGVRAVWCIVKFSETGERLRAARAGDRPAVPAPDGAAPAGPSSNGAHRGEPDRTAR
jgi:hypothetical protein